MDAFRTHTDISAIFIESALSFSLLSIGFAITFGKTLVEGTYFQFFMVSLLCMLLFIVIKIEITDCAAIYHLPSHFRKSWTEDIMIQARATSY